MLIINTSMLCQLLARLDSRLEPVKPFGDQTRVIVLIGTPRDLSMPAVRFGS